MGLWTNIRKAIGDRIAGNPISAGERRFTALFPSLPQVPGNWTANRFELAGHFRGWPYVAIDTICREIAILPPTFARVVSAPAVRDRVEKSLRTGMSWDAALKLERLKLFSRPQKKKSLIHIQGNDEIEPFPTAHPAVKLFHKPNPHDYYWTFAYKIAMNLKLHGTAYIWDVRDHLGRPCELWPIPSHWVRDIPGRNRLIDGYEVWPASGYVPTDLGMGFYPGIVGGRARFDYSEMIVIRYPSPISHIDGYSPMQAVGPWVDISNNIDSSRVQTFMNGAFPGVVIEIDPMAGELSPEEGERLKAKILAEWTGVRHTKRPVVLTKGITLKPFTQATSELEYNQSSEQMRSHLLATYKVPQSMVGLVEPSTFSNADAAKLNFYRSTMKPELSYWSQVFTHWGKEAFEDKDFIGYWPDPTPEDPDYILRRQDQGLRNGTTHPNEVREEQGKEPYEYGGDDPQISMGAHFVGWNTGQAPAMPGLPDPSQQPEAGQVGGEQEPGQVPQPDADPNAAAQPAAPSGQEPVDANAIIQNLLAGGKNAPA